MYKFLMYLITVTVQISSNFTSTDNQGSGEGALSLFHI